MFASKVKLPIVIIFLSALFIVMFGTLTAYGYTPDGIGFEDGITANYIVAAFVWVGLWLLLSFMVGVNNNFIGVVFQWIVGLFPLVGFIGGTWETVGFYWGTIHYMPILSLFKATNLVGFFVMDAIVMILCVVMFIAGKKWKAAQAY